MTKDLAPASTVDDPALTVTVTNILSLSTEELEQYRAELDAARPDDPYLAHDREALRRAEAIRNEQEAA